VFGKLVFAIAVFFLIHFFIYFSLWKSNWLSLA